MVHRQWCRARGELFVGGAVVVGVGLDWRLAVIYLYVGEARGGKRPSPV